MRLHIKKNQAKGIIGGVKFELFTKVTLTQEESMLIEKYDAKKEILTNKEIKIPFTEKVIQININIGSLVSGQKFSCKDIADILQYENNVKEACETFKLYLETMKTFEGEEIIEYGINSTKIVASTKNSDELKQPNEIVEDDTLGETDEENEYLSFCYHCGEELNESVSVCPKCGKQL